MIPNVPKKPRKPYHAISDIIFCGLGVCRFGDSHSTFRIEARLRAKWTPKIPKTWYCEPVEMWCKKYIAAVARLERFREGCVQGADNYICQQPHVKPHYADYNRGGL